MIHTTVIMIIIFFSLIAFILPIIFSDAGPIERTLSGFGAAFVVFVLGAIVVNDIINTIAINKGEYVAFETQSLKAISIDEDLQGSFFLGCGKITTGESFVYISEVDGLGYKIQEIGISQCYIVEENIEQPYLEKAAIKWKDWSVNEPDTYRHIFHIPPNSIKENYEVDINN